MAKTFPANASKTNLDDAVNDDPKQGRLDLVDLVDKFNALKDALAPLAAMAIGAGLSVTSNPAGTADVLNVQQVSSFSTGDCKITLKAVADTGWVMANDGSIGSASSGATTRANADTQPLYELIWNEFADAYAPVTGGRGATATADFLANKAIKLGTVVGRALAVAGAGAGLTNRAMGQFLGEEAHALSAAENGPHDHDQVVITGPAGGVTGPGRGTLSTPLVSDVRTGSSGSGTPHNTMQPTVFLKLMIKL